MKPISVRLRKSLFLLLLAGSVCGCYTPKMSQKYFIEATSTDPALEPIYSTSLYTVYFDYALARCVVHSTHTWGQQGGGGGGTGIGIAAFRCDPNRVRARAQSVGLTTFPPKMAPSPSRQQPNAPSTGSPTVIRSGAAQESTVQSPVSPGGMQ